LTHSYTAPLDISALLSGANPEHEVIMSYDFVSLANALYLNGARPVFVDIRPNTMNIDEIRIDDAITQVPDSK
jgi:dTDP-4-amino-4,6-dideoxygalactose transaminase